MSTTKLRSSSNPGFYALEKSIAKLEEPVDSLAGAAFCLHENI